ncbi:MAG: PspC domain-containing protein [Streptosporangiales bacterium]|nr:PspC domain-containing protein [Streptosporangiales bacterium]
MAEAGTSRPPLRRRTQGRVAFGVCAGLAAHLGLHPGVVRLAFVALSMSGIGFAAYIVLIFLLPRAEEEPSRPDIVQLVAYGALGAALGLVYMLSGTDPDPLLWPLIFGALGGAILWQQAAPDRRERWLATTTFRVRQTWVRSIVGVVLVLVGITGFLAARNQLSEARQGLVSTLAVVIGITVIATPWIIGLMRDRDRERRERIRTQERAEFAAHIHDSVLHTLTLIQRSSDDPREVQRLARVQERALRTWLYRPQDDSGASVSAAAERVAAEVEEHHGVPIDLVTVGDCAVDERVAAALQAAREAMVNAAKYSGADTVSVYVEADPEELTIFVRDRGRGFDRSAVPEDRMGVKESIIGRMERHGGTATVRSAPGEGTEVQVRIKREKTDE